MAAELNSEDAIQAKLKADKEAYEKERKIAFTKGLRILLLVLGVSTIINLIIALTKGLWVIAPILISLFIIFPLFYFLVVYFIWGRKDIGGVFVKEGYVAILTSGSGKAERPIINTRDKALNKKWEVVSASSPDAFYKDRSIFGLHLFIPFFEGIYSQDMRWRKWDDLLRNVIPRVETVRQFSIMDYPIFVDAIKVEDKERNSLNLYTAPITRMLHVYQTLFEITTDWHVLLAAELQGAYNAFIKSKSLDELIVDKKSLSALLYDFLKEYIPVVEFIDPEEEKYNKFLNRILRKYGIILPDILVIDIEGADKETREAIKAKALAILQAEAIKVMAGAERGKIAEIARAPYISAMANFTMHTGITEEKLQQAFQENTPEYQRYEPIFNKYLKEAVEQIYSERNQVFKIKNEGKGSIGGSSTFNDVTAALIASQNMKNIGGQSGGTVQATQSTTQKNTEDSSGEKKKTLREKADDVLRKY